MHVARQAVNQEQRRVVGERETAALGAELQRAHLFAVIELLQLPGIGGKQSRSQIRKPERDRPTPYSSPGREMGMRERSRRSSTATSSGSP